MYNLFSMNKKPQALPVVGGDVISAMLARSEERKRWLYFWALLAGIPSVYLAWVYYSQHNAFIRFGYPVLLVFMALWVGGLLWQRIPLRWLEYSVITSVSLLFFAKYVYLLFFEPNLHAEWAEVEAVFWSMAMVFIIGYVAAAHQVAFRMALVYVFVTLVFGVWRLYASDYTLFLELLRLQVRLFGIALLSFILAKAKDDLLTAQREAANLEWMANTDHLTYLPNRRMLTVLIEQRLLGSAPFAVLVVDIDHFKSINDTYGHNVGDLVLARVAQTLQAHLRPTDFAARWGGEEFLVLVHESEKTNVLRLAERLRSEIENLQMESIRLTISVGATIRRKEDTLATLVERADKALYAAKQDGRNLVCWQD